MKKFYITTAIDYVNSAPHIGTAYEKIGADVLARYKRLAGYDTFFLMGNDEHSLNVEKKAKSLNMPTLSYCDKMESEFKNVWSALNLSFDYFIRTSSKIHIASVGEIFKRIYKNGDIFKGIYKGCYCVSCEAYVRNDDLVEGKCPIHKSEPKWLEEENYFFKLTNYKDKLLKYINENPVFIEPAIRKNEIVNVIEKGLEDISISRASTKWGIPVPDDPSQVIYVWFDALINYLSGAGFSSDKTNFDNTWPADIHIIGKDITRFHCIIWPAMLMSAGITLPKKVFGHGFVYIKGQKMSKSSGTVENPIDIANKYGPDTLKYFLLREISFDNDGDFSAEKFTERYNSDLANDLGNLLHRTTNMINKYQGGVITSPSEFEAIDHNLKDEIMSFSNSYEQLMDKLAFSNALENIWSKINLLNTYIERTTPWFLARESKRERIATVLYNVAESLRITATLLSPFMPNTATKILEQIGLSGQDSKDALKLDLAKKWGYIGGRLKINMGPPLFPKIE